MEDRQDTSDIASNELSIQEQKQKYLEEWRTKRLAELKAECVRALMCQTTWSEEEAIKHLEENKYNVLACVRIFMGMPPVREESKSSSNSYSSVNQGIYSEIRLMMDEASRKYEEKKRREEKLQDLQLRRQALLQAQNEQQIKKESTDAD